MFCAPSFGPETAGVALLEAMASGATVVASQIRGYDEVVQNEGQRSPRPAARRRAALAAALSRVLGDDELRHRLSAQALRASRRYDWDRVTGEVEDVYEEVARRRRDPLPRRRRQQRELFADFHIHSHHSKDCVMPVADILERAREVGLDVVAITDHDTAAGGLEARDLADRYGVRVIVGEEVKTSEGEVIGLFLERTIPGGMTFAETIAAIRDQGGSSTFRIPSTACTPSRARPCCAPTSPTSTWSRSSTRGSPSPASTSWPSASPSGTGLPAAAGSDSHVLPGIGTTLCGIDDFTGPDDFVRALSESRIVRRPRSLIYLQSLKLLQTTMGGAAKDDGQEDSPA